MEIKVGEYVRTKNGYIAQITEIDKYIWFNNKINKESGMPVYELSKIEFENLVTKHSKNIIDLIEVGDVGKFFMEYDEDNEDTNIFEIVGKTSDNKELCVITSDYQIDYFPVENLREILTHEQFGQNAYRLEEK